MSQTKTMKNWTNNEKIKPNEDKHKNNKNTRLTKQSEEREGDNQITSNLSWQHSHKNLWNHGHLR